MKINPLFVAICREKNLIFLKQAFEIRVVYKTDYSNCTICYGRYSRR